MFTGLVEGKGRIVLMESDDFGMLIQVDLGLLAQDAKIGDSICISGCCLTVTSLVDTAVATFQLGTETLSKTRFQDWKVGTLVNIERSLKVGDRMGGHFVSGHVDGLAELLERREEGEWSHFLFSVSEHLANQMVDKGSIAIDGVSLTLVSVGKSQFSIALIPHTLSVTTLGELKVGDRVHIETDILAKYAQKGVFAGT